MRELALAAFAAETDAHLVTEPRDKRFERFARGFDTAGYLAGLGREGGEDQIAHAGSNSRGER